MPASLASCIMQPLAKTAWVTPCDHSLAASARTPSLSACPQRQRRAAAVALASSGVMARALTIRCVNRL